MSGKYIYELTLKELRRECEVRDLSTSGGKPELEIRLAEYLRTNGIDPANVRFEAEVQLNSGVTQHHVSNDETNRSPLAQTRGSLGEFTNAQLLGSDLGNNHRFQSTSNPIDTATTKNVFESASKQLGALRKSIDEGGERNSLEARLTALEASMTSFFEEQRQFSRGMRRTDFDVADQPSRLHEQVRPPINPNDNTYVRERFSRINPSFYDNVNRPFAPTGDGRVDAAASTAYYARNLTGEPTTYCENARNFSTFAPRVQERSVLIPYEDLRAARASLPEFSGTRAEDPVRFLDNTESVLAQANIPMSGWCRAVEQQLKGTAATWWKSIKVLDLSWYEFRVEFLDNFDNDEIKLRLRADILSTHQTATQTLTEFILNKNQLARRVNTGLSESELVHYITGLTRDVFRTHIRLRQPSTFAELRRIASILDPVTNTHAPSPNRKELFQREKISSHTNKGVFPNRGQPATKPRADFSKKKPPGPCKFCGELHWQSDCPHRPTTSGNGGGANRD